MVILVNPACRGAAMTVLRTVAMTSAGLLRVEPSCLQRLPLMLGSRVAVAAGLHSRRG